VKQFPCLVKAIPYGPILDITKQKLGILETDSVESIVAKALSGVAEVGLDPPKGASIVLLLLGIRDGSERVEMLTPEIIKARTFELESHGFCSCG